MGDVLRNANKRMEMNQNDIYYDHAYNYNNPYSSRGN
jgi:hypothetical protein